MDRKGEMADLIQRAQGGNFKSLCAIVERLRGRLQRMSDYYAIRCGQEAEDMFQEAWLGALEALKEVDVRVGDPEQYIIKMAKWRLLNFAKWNRKRQHESLEKLEAFEPSSRGFLAVQTHYQPESISQFNQTIDSAHISQFVSQLNHRQRELLNLLLTGNTWREAASKLGYTSANVAYHVKRIQKVYLRWIGNGGSAL